MHRINGGIIGPRLTITTNFTTASGIWDKGEYSRLWALDLWPSLSDLTLTYTISGNSSATFNGVTITGNAGGNGGYGGGGGGGYSITNDNRTGGGANGGNGYGTGGFGGNGTRGGSIGGGYNSGSNDVSGLYAAVTLAGYTGDSSFGSGGRGGANFNYDSLPGSFAGGGGGGGAYIGGYSTGSVGGSGAIVILYNAGGTNYCTVKTSSGSFLVPKGTIYLKMWAIGTGGQGGYGGGGGNSGAGGGGAGVAYCEFVI